MNVLLLRGVVGSTAYGLAREGSDIDKLGVFAAPARRIAGWDWTPNNETVVSRNPDSTSHEVRKFLKLAIKGNPTVNELLWLDSYTEMDDYGLGRLLIARRRSLLSTPTVRNAYFGYAQAQAHKLRLRGDSFSSDTKNRTAKHARHMLRLLEQAERLFKTGELQIKVGNPDWYFEMDDWTPERVLERFDRRLAAVENAAMNSVLPDAPDVVHVKNVLHAVRDTHR